MSVLALRRVLAAAATALLFSLPCAAQGGAASGAALKAAFLLNFVEFVEWPGGTAADEPPPIVLCVVGDDALQDAASGLAEKRAGKRPISVARRGVDDVATGCQVLYIGAAQRGRVTQILREVRGRSVLTVSDVDRFVAAEGMIGFVEEGNRLRFDVNLASAQRSALKISSKLLTLAKTVIRD